MAKSFKDFINEHSSIIQNISSDTYLQKSIQATIHLMTNCFRKKGKVLFCGNGGSAADAEHLAGELSGRFKLERDPLFAEALHTNGAALTAISNDYSYIYAFSRILKSKGKPGDVLLAFSTSGTSENIIETLKTAKEIGLSVIGLCGEHTATMAPFSDLVISIPSSNTPRIQEAHMLIGHYICEEVERQLFNP